MAIAQMPSKLVYETDELHFFSRQAGCKGFFLLGICFYFLVLLYIYISPSFLSMMQLFPFPY